MNIFDVEISLAGISNAMYHEKTLWPFQMFKGFGSIRNSKKSIFLIAFSESARFDNYSVFF